MRNCWLLILAAALSLTALPGCRRKQADRTDQAPVGGRGAAPANWDQIPARPVAHAELGPARQIEAGVNLREATLRPPGGPPMQVWYYEPEQHNGKLPLVLVPPAGSTLWVGMGLGDGDYRDEHLPYVRAGFAVAAFEIDGDVPNMEKATDEALLQGAQVFRDSMAGLVNVKMTIDFVLAKAPQIDSKRIYIAGHSSAATLALLAAEYEPRIKACAAYAPATDVPARLAQGIDFLEENMPGFTQFIRLSSPNTHPERLKCPVFLFHAQDDATLPVWHSTNFATALRRTNSKVTLELTPRGGHYDSMIQEGVPKGIAWFRSLP